MDKVLFSQIDQHHTFCLLKAQSEELCKPLLENLPIDFYNFERFYYDHSYLILGSALDAVPEYAKHAHVMPDSDLLCLNTSPYAFLSESVPLPSMPEADLSLFVPNTQLTQHLLDIKHRFCLTFYTPQYVEVHTYGIKNNVDDVIYFYLSQLKSLNFFSKYFRAAAQHLIVEAEKNKVFIFPKKNYVQVNNLINYNHQLFVKEILAKKHTLIGKRGACVLTAREFECLVLLTCNKTAKEIGRMLCLSSRTVEEYVVNIRRKLGCESRYELMEVANDNPIVRTFAEVFRE